MTPERFLAPVDMRPNPHGSVVRFADVEEALRDADRLAWILPLIDGKEREIAERRMAALDVGVREGLTGRELVDFARRACGDLT